MTYAQMALRFLISALNHPVSQTLLKHALRAGTAELVRAVQHHTRTRKGKIHIS